MTDLKSRLVEALEVLDGIFRARAVAAQDPALRKTLLALAEKYRALAAELAEYEVVPDEQAVFVGIQKYGERQQGPCAVFATAEQAKAWEDAERPQATIGKQRFLVCVPFRAKEAQ